MSLIVETSTPNGYDLKLQTGLFINNEFVKGGSTLETINPSNGKVITSVQAAEKEDVEKAVVAAEKAFEGPWSKMSSGDRAKLIYKLAELIDRDNEELSQIETLDNGKGITFSRNFDAKQIAITLRYYAGWADKIHGKVIDTDGALSYTRHEPIGVCAAIIPWNFPLMMLGWKLGPALCTGNTVIVKSSELTPLSAIKVAQLVVEAGFPPGVVNIITGFGPIAGDALARHPRIAKVAFTGSTAVGRKIMAAAADSNLKKVTLELGGKSPNIIFDDADIDQAVRWAHKGIFFNHGQCCCAGSRVLVQSSVYDEFLSKFKEYTSKTKLGNPHEDDTYQGPQVSQTQFDRIMGYIEAGKKQGATCFMGGKRWGTEGYFIEPTVFTDVKDDMTIVQEEIFGPVVVVSKFDTMEEAVKMANDTDYGLAAAVFTRDSARSVEVANRIKAGTVWVNCYNELDYNTPFGGFRQSGIGRENGEYALDNYIQVKTVKINVSREAY
ncbi:aldehyde dehydrogenase [Backusella circina FSU 941]|nr:aldehyde dehydrogenase [Backusella circina FSU 941]